MTYAIGGVAVLMVGLLLWWLRRGAVDPREATDLAIPLRRFARSAVSLITAGDDYGYLPARPCQDALRDGWAIVDVATTARCLYGLLEEDRADATAAAWNLVRVIHVARLAAGAGYLTQEGSWQYVAHAATGLQRRFASWPQLAGAFAHGRASWAGSVGRDVTAITRQTQANIAACREQWRLMPFETRLV